jgi:cytochrome c peroxidase
MTKRGLTFVLVALAATGCKKDEAKDEGGGGGTGTATSGTTVTKPAPTPAANRPSQGTLPQLPKLELPDDPKRDAKIALGHALFFDKRLSVDGTMACYSCHLNEDGNGGHDPKAVGPGGKQLPRHSPVIWNVAWYKNAFYWDGRSPTLEAQGKAAWAGGNMGVGEDKLQAKTDEIAKIAGYKKMFADAFGGEKPSPDHVASALAEYERTLLCSDTKYDKFAAGDKTALDEAQQRGLDVFMGKGMCSACHTPPFFSAAMNVDGGVYFNVGIGTQGKPEAEVDPGRMKVSNNANDWAAFKPPSLRNIAKSAPYLHDGSAAMLDDVLKIMTTGGIPNKNLTPVMGDRKLTAEELADLKAFLGALDCGTLEPPKTMP